MLGTTLRWVVDLTIVHSSALSQLQPHFGGPSLHGAAMTIEPRVCPALTRHDGSAIESGTTYDQRTATEPQLLYSIRVGGYEGLRLRDCVARLEESGLSYLDNFDNAWTNVTRRLPSHGAVKLHSIRLTDDEALKFAHYLQVPAHDKPLLLGHVVMQIAHAQHREFQAVVYNETVQAQLKGRVLTAEQARFRAGLPRFEDIYIMGIKRVDLGTEEHWYPEIVY
ncbi:hypothetical protein C8T65DRAFT_164332 [Cerioporus squamosus]|nr:hypothetical protein C8T65DRAFT_164332 [Cerioporus squamosus]